MSDYLPFIFSGLVTGGIYGLAGTGLVLTYKTSGVFNFAYGALATYVTEHAVAVDGLIREYYLVGPQDTDDESAWRTEVGWPIFETRHHQQ